MRKEYGIAFGSEGVVVLRKTPNSQGYCHEKHPGGGTFYFTTWADAVAWLNSEVDHEALGE